VEHEASTSKIGEDQIFYCRQRGISTEDAVSMIVHGFCKEVFRELPMEFAVEAQKLLGVSLEGSVGMMWGGWHLRPVVSKSSRPAASTEKMSLLEIKDLHATVGDREILKGIDADHQRRRGPRHHGAERLRQEHAGAGAGGRELYVGDRREVIYDGKDLLAMSPEDRAREGIFLAFQYPVEIPGVSNMYFLKAALNTIRKHRGLEELDAMDFLALVKEKMKLMKMDETLLNRRSTPASPAAKRSATRFSRWPCWSRAWRFSTKPIPAWISTPCEAWWRRRQRRCALPSAP
jgi:hypothetical protein